MVLRKSSSSFPQVDDDFLSISQDNIEQDSSIYLLKGAAMYCPNCQCEFDGWKNRCPQCRSALAEKPPPMPETTNVHLSYADLVEFVKSRGEVKINLRASNVKRERKWQIPYLGYGYAWAKKFQGVVEGFGVGLETQEEGRNRRWSFPYFGYGYAWIKNLEGNIGGHPLTLKAVKVHKERKQRFPYRGYGFAWTEELQGSCGDQLHAHLEINEVGRKMSRQFPYLGYGFAWEAQGTLKLAIAATG